MRSFLIIGLNKNSNKNRARRSFFYSVFSFGKLRGSSLTYLPVFVALYLILFENMDQMSEKHIFLLLLHWDEADDVIILVT